MRTIQFIIWFGIFLSIYTAANAYIFIRMWQALQAYPMQRTFVSALFIFLAVSYWLSRLIESISLCAISDMLFWIGSFWFGAMLYFFMAVLLIDIVRAANHFILFIPASFSENMNTVKLTVLLSVSLITALLLFIGALYANSPVITEQNITLRKGKGTGGSITMAMVTDIHMGVIVKNAHLEKMATLINEIHPEIVLLGGDQFDENLKPVIKNDLGDILKAISSKYPTYAITGNHEFYGGIEEACRYMEEHSVILLRDRGVKIKNQFYLIGRDDKTKNDFEKEKRKFLKDILIDTDRNYPLILMNHNPAGINDASEEGIDLMLSGHTHHGQLWPLNYITSKIYQVDRGYGKIGGTQVYVSTGFGTWGPPVRLGSRPEVVKLTIKFQ